VGRGVNRKPRKVQGGSAKMGREGSRKSRTVPGVNAEVGRGGAGNQGRCRESAQRWAWGTEHCVFSLLWDGIAEDEE
jgi:hypothetical protein